MEMALYLLTKKSVTFHNSKTQCKICGFIAWQARNFVQFVIVLNEKK